MTRTVFKLLAGLIIVTITAIAGLYFYITTNDISGYVKGFTKPYGIEINGPVNIKFWPNIQANITDIKTPAIDKPIKNVTIHLPFLELVRHIIWQKPIQNADIDIKALALAERMLDISAEIKIDNEHTQAHVKIMGIDENASFDVFTKDFKMITVSNGLYKQKDNSLNNINMIIQPNNDANFAQGSVKASWNDIKTPENLQFKVTRSPKGFSVSAQTPTIKSPQITLQNVNTLVHQTQKQIIVESFKANTLKGNIQTSAILEGEKLKTQGEAHDLDLTEILKDKKAIVSGKWDVHFNTTNLDKTLSGNTDITLTSFEMQGIDLANLKNQINNLKVQKIEDLERIKDQLTKPGIIKGDGFTSIHWNNGVGTLQKSQIRSSGLEANTIGQVNFNSFNGRVEVSGLQVPVGIFVKGSFDKLDYQIDWNALVPLIMQKAAKQTIEKQGQKLLEKALKLDDPNQKDALKSALGNALGKILG